MSSPSTPSPNSSSSPASPGESSFVRCATNWSSIVGFCPAFFPLVPPLALPSFSAPRRVAGGWSGSSHGRSSAFRFENLGSHARRPRTPRGRSKHAPSRNANSSALRTEATDVRQFKSVQVKCNAVGTCQDTGVGVPRQSRARTEILALYRRPPFARRYPLCSL